MINASDKPWHEAFEVRIKTNAPVKMFGDIEEKGSTVIFRPLVPLTPGMNYEVVADGNVVGEISIPVADHSEATTLEIYPSQDTLPENLLKMYLKFSRPMQEGHTVDYLTLVTDNGDTMRGTFLDLKPELWNASRDMVTVWLDPGRIKRGLHPNEQLGQPLIKGQHYTLSVSAAWKDIDGVSLSSAYKKTFTVVRRDSLAPDVSAWRIDPPGANTTERVCVNFPESMDYALLHATLRVTDETGVAVPGQWTVDLDETRACFKPISSWARGIYSLQIETRLEDVAGNNINRAFEVDIASAKADDAQRSPAVVTRKFETTIR